VKAGDRVEVVTGPYEGRVGVIDAIWIEGLAVRILADPPAWPFPRMVVFEHAELKRIRTPRRGIRMPTDLGEAPF
jgi:hypothetical protein